MFSSITFLLILFFYVVFLFYYFFFTHTIVINPIVLHTILTSYLCKYITVKKLTLFLELNIIFLSLLIKTSWKGLCRFRGLLPPWRLSWNVCAYNFLIKFKVAPLLTSCISKNPCIQKHYISNRKCRMNKKKKQDAYVKTQEVHVVEANPDFSVCLIVF